MTRFVMACGFWLAGLACARAQVSVELSTDQQQYLPGESLVALVKISNQSGQALRLGKGQDWLTFNVEARGNQPIARNQEPNVEGEYVLESAQVATKKVDIAPCFGLDKPGRYQLSATVRIPQFGQELTTAPKWFDIINGTKSWERDFGVPIPGAPTGQPPEARKFALIQAIHLKELKLYVRLSDVSGSRIMRVMQAGRYVSFSNPQATLDRTNTLHVLWQTGARAYDYVAYNCNGDMVLRQTHDIVAGARPSLKMNSLGDIKVEGGQRRWASNDFPPPGPPTPLKEESKPAPKEQP